MGDGLAWVLIPVSRRIPDASGAGVEPASAGEPFNAHPYLSTIAIGALARAAREGAPAARIRRFREVLRSPLGALGDKLFWEAWRPFCLLAVILAALLGLGATWVLAGLLVAYNAVHLYLRSWGLRLGLGAGLEVGRALGAARLAAHAERIEAAGVLVAGILIGFLSFRIFELPATGLAWLGTGAMALAAGLFGGNALRRWAPGILVLIVFVGLVVSFELTTTSMEP